MNLVCKRSCKCLFLFFIFPESFLLSCNLPFPFGWLATRSFTGQWTTLLGSFLMIFDPIVAFSVSRWLLICISASEVVFLARSVQAAWFGLLCLCWPQPAKLFAVYKLLVFLKKESCFGYMTGLSLVVNPFGSFLPKCLSSAPYTCLPISTSRSSSFSSSITGACVEQKFIASAHFMYKKWPICSSGDGGR